MSSALPSWLKQIQSWFAPPPSPTPGAALDALPEIVHADLLQQIRSLPIPDRHHQWARQVIWDAVQTWQQDEAAPNHSNSGSSLDSKSGFSSGFNPGSDPGSNSLSQRETPNHLVILSSPVEPIAQVLMEVLQDWQEELSWINPLPWTSRLDDPATVATTVRQTLEEFLSHPLSHAKSSGKKTDDSPSLMVIPDLSQYFMRCIHGWEGIELLRDWIVQDADRFWIIGCNRWTWKFLNYVCQVEAYFEQVESLPLLEGDDLENWLLPLVETLAIRLPKVESDEPPESYWYALASQSLGLSGVAAQIWLQSLRAIDDADSQSDKTYENYGDLTLHQVKPIASSLPNLTAEDRYLLHALLLHGNISRSHLALTLGDSESIVQARVQVLLRSGIIRQQQGRLSVNPAYYPKLKTVLSNNNFMVGED